MPADGLKLTLEISSNVSSYSARLIVFWLRSLKGPVVPLDGPVLPLRLYHFSATPVKRAKRPPVALHPTWDAVSRRVVAKCVGKASGSPRWMMFEAVKTRQEIARFAREQPPVDVSIY